MSANIERECQCCWLLTSACEKNHPGCSLSILDDKPYWNEQQTADFSKAVYAAAWRGHIDVLNILIANKAPLDKEALIDAADFGKTEAVRILLAAKCPMSRSAWTVSFEKHWDVVELLVHNGCPHDKAKTLEAINKGEFNPDTSLPFWQKYQPEPESEPESNSEQKSQPQQPEPQPQPQGCCHLFKKGKDAGKICGKIGCKKHTNTPQQAQPIPQQVCGCAYVFVKGACKGQTCGKVGCKKHAEKIAPITHTPIQVEGCQYVFKKGANRGERCCAKNCKKHSQ
jgi:hypothetical protein